MNHGTKTALQAGATAISVALFAATYVAVRGAASGGTEADAAVTQTTQTTQITQQSPLQQLQRQVPVRAVHTRTRAS